MHNYLKTFTFLFAFFLSGNLFINAANHGIQNEDDCEQGNRASDGFEEAYVISANSGFRIADDFFVSGGNTLNVKSIEINLLIPEGSGPVQSLNFDFYTDAGAGPAESIYSLENLTPYDQVMTNNLFGMDLYTVIFEVDLDFEGGEAGATYWMSPSSNASNIYWEMLMFTEGLGSAVYFSENNSPWMLDGEGGQGIFTLHCELVSAPEPECSFGILYDVEPISRVLISNVDNPSDAMVNGSPDLEDFTSIQIELSRGATYEIAVEGNTNGNFENQITAFIDWNQNGVFDDEGEVYQIGTITNSDGTDSIQAVGGITVPVDALEGATQMRIIKAYGGYPMNPCSSYQYGQGEDYTVLVGQLGVKDLNSTDFTFYPNPVEDVLYINFQSSVEQLDIYNLAGQKMRSDQLTSSKEFDVSGLPSGVYMVRAKLENGEQKTFKFIKK